MAAKEKADPIDINVGKNIRFHRNRLGITQTQLADAIGVKFQQVQKYETGANRISASRLVKTAQFLEVDVNVLLFNTNAKEEEDSFEELEVALNTLSAICHQESYDAGWYHDPVTKKKLDRNIPEMISLIHSEISEALEALRKNKMDDKLSHRRGIEVELADALIRIFDLAGYQQLDLGGAVIDKIIYNRSRADHKIENRTKKGGKSF